MALSRSRRRSAWPDLAPDLLGAVLRRLPSLADRVRLGAVCRPWHSSAATVLHESPPQLPWLAFHDGALLDVSNNTAHRVRLPNDGATSYSAGENMLFVLHDDGRCSVMNTFSSDVTPLPELAALLKAHDVKSSEIIKVVMSSASRLAAVLFRSISGSNVIAFTSHGPDGEISSRRVLKCDRYSDTILDIAIFQGKIHAVNSDINLLAVQLNNGKQTPRFRRIVGGASLPSTDSHGVYEIRRYLVESNGKLLMVRRWVTDDRYYPESRGETSLLSVVEADLNSRRWNNVDDLERQALFVSVQCSKSVAGGDGARHDCIYFLDEYGLGDYGAYCMGDGTITPLLPEHHATPLPLGKSRPASPAWFFPVEV